jgi:hypothetical protein
MPSVCRKEWLWVLAWSVVIVIITSLPYLYGAIISTPESEFSGFVTGLEDGHSYLSKMQQGRSGYWLFRLAYTPEPRQAELFFLFYILLGKIAGLTNLPNVLIFHLGRLVTIPLGLLGFYYFAAYFIEQVRVRRFAWLIFSFTGGLGWSWLILGGAAELGRMPVDLWVPDASFFLAALTYAHLPLAQGLLLLLSVASFEFVCQGQKWIGFLAAGCGLAVSLIHPQTLPVISLILGLHILWQHYHQKQQLFIKMTRLVLIILPTLPYLLYVFVVFNRNPAFITWRVQSLTYSPAPLHYLLGFGFTLIFAAIGFGLTWPAVEPKHRFLQVWVIAVPVLVYLPITLQRRFLDGYQAPLAVLAAIGLSWVIEKIHGRFWQAGTVILVLVGMSLTNVLLATGAMITVAQRSRPIFIPVAEVEAARWLGQHVTADDVVLAAYETGNYLPTRMPARVFVGHGPETVYSDEKRKMLDQFFAPENDNLRRQLLRDYHITFLFYGLVERALGSFSPAEASYLQQAYDNGVVQIYRVVEANRK